MTPAPLALSTQESLWLALPIALALAGLHIVAPRLRGMRRVPERMLGSFAGGAAVAYVFLHLLPDLAAGNASVGETLQNRVEAGALLDLAIFAVALSGFLLLFGLERLARRTVSPTSGDPPAGVFYLHLATYAVSNALVTYTTPLRLRTGVTFALLSRSRSGCTSS